MIISDIIQIISILVALSLGVISIFISIKTLQQNRQMIEDSTRPYIVVYVTQTNFDLPLKYLVVKNFGSSGAQMHFFNCDFDLSQLSLVKNQIPFSEIQHSYIAPNQSFVCAIDYDKIVPSNKHITFNFSYSSGTNTYTEQIKLNLLANEGNLHEKIAPENEELKTICFTLQELVEKQL